MARVKWGSPKLSAALLLLVFTTWGAVTMEAYQDQATDAAQWLSVPGHEYEHCLDLWAVTNETSCTVTYRRPGSPVSPDPARPGLRGVAHFPTSMVYEDPDAAHRDIKAAEASFVQTVLMAWHTVQVALVAGAILACVLCWDALED